MRELKQYIKIIKAITISMLIAVVCFGAIYLADSKLIKMENASVPADASVSDTGSMGDDPTVELSGRNTAEIGEALCIADMILSVENGNLINGAEAVDTSVLGDGTAVINIAGSDGSIYTVNAPYTVKDTTAPLITLTSNPSVRKGRSIDLLASVSVADNSGEEITVTVTGDYSFDTEGEYNITYTCADSSGNTASADAVLSVYIPAIEYSDTAVKTPETINTATYALPYAVTVYREYGTVVVWGPDETGHFTVPVRSCITSTGKGNNTPLGTFYTPQKYEWRMLKGEVYGQYSTRITGQILFHSVPYKERDKSTLKYWLYNRLGEKDSLGCIRLTVEDAKWIYDNCPLGTAVTITADPVPTGIERPEAMYISADNPNNGWDPTDPDPANPWHSGE